MKKRLTILGIICLLSLAAIIATVFLLRDESPPQDTIVIVIPQNSFVRNMDTNYFKLWLEEQTGLALEFIYIPESMPSDYLDMMFSSGNVRADGVFAWSSKEDYLSTLSLLQSYGEKGYILPINEFLDGSTNLEKIFQDFDGYDLKKVMTSPDGKLYFMPGLDSSESKRVGQVLWLNRSWLTKLKLTVPQTTEDLRDVLTAFKTLDPNGNGLQEEIPLAGSKNIYSRQSYNFIINAFIYNDPENSHLLVKDGQVIFAPITDEWREAMKYLNNLYAEGLLSPLQFELSEQSLSQLAMEPKDLLGGFTADSITDVLLQNSPEIISNYVHVAPLSGPDGVRLAMAKSPMPKPAGIITATSKNPAAVFRLFDLMLSEKAFLIGRYGEKSTDWVEAFSTDIDSYGNKATVRVINQLGNKVQNKHICEMGPFFAYPKYADGVTFSGFEADHEYVNARAYRVYEQYKPKEYIKTLLFENAQDWQTLRRAIDAYTDESIEAFITGKKDPFNDAVWAEHLRKYRDMDIDELTRAASTT